MRLTLAMFGVFRRRVVSGSSSASVLLHPRIVGKDQIVCHTVQSGAMNLRPLRKVMTSLKPCVSMQIQSRMFSSDSGDLVDVAVPFMGESISYGTLATFLKKTGEMVEVNEPIAQVKTDMVTINVASPEVGVIQEVNIINVASPEAGVIQEFVVKERDSVESGTKIAIISKSAAASPSPPKDETDPGGIKEEMKDMKKKIDEILDNLAVRKEMKEMKKELESDALGLRKEIKIIQECTSFHGIGFLILIIYWFMK